MFVMIENPEFENEANGMTPGDTGEPFSFRARYVALGATEQKTFDLGTEDGTADFLKRTMVGIADVKDADGSDLTFSDTVRDWLIDMAHTRTALVQGYFDGLYKGKLGN